MNEMQQKLGILDAEAAAARDRARQMEAKASSLESEKALLATAEQRLTTMINDLSAEKHKLMAQSQVEQKVGGTISGLDRCSRIMTLCVML